ncbi:50S ribosomal protein L9 [bacterium]|nr:50S ribosomal protein L9 [bacterium]
MKIILRQMVEGLGEIGDVIHVKNGYARNFLIPQKMAVEATTKNIRMLEEEKKMSKRREHKNKNEAEALAQELEKISVTATVAVGEEDRVFGSVTSQTIADLLSKKGHEIDKRKVILDEPIKALGVYTVPIKLHSEVEAKIRVWVVKE